MNDLTRPNARLRLRACDRHDLEVLSASLQDAIVPISDMTYLPDERRFVMVVNRFKWECGSRSGAETRQQDGEAPTYLRTSCGVRFEGVRAARLNGIDQHDRQQFLVVLAICPDEEGATVVFSGGGRIRLECDGIDCCLEDIGEPWPTPRRPEHAFEEDGQTP